MSTPKGFADLASLPEDQRIGVIACYVVDHGNTVAVALEDEPKKVARYVRKILASRPGLLEIEKRGGIVAGTITLCVKPKAQNVQNN